MDAFEDCTDNELQNVLDSWNLGHLYEVLIEQNITINVLKILKPHHIARLFENQTLGDHAIFEHQLELWKQDILLNYHKHLKNAKKNSKPIQIQISELPKETTTPTISIQSQNNPSINFKNNHTVQSSSSDEELAEVSNTPSLLVPQTSRITRIQLPTTNENLNNLKQMPRSQNLNQSLPVQPTQNITLPTLPTVAATLPTLPTLPTRPNYTTTPLPSAGGSGSVLQTPIVSKVVPYSPVIPPPPSRYNVRQILEETSGGQVLVHYYQKHKILREEHRTALINVIARYIEVNGCGLTTSESSQLENQIIELFPTEREEFYRTKHRGRLYNKIANMRRNYKKLREKEPTDNVTTPTPSSPSQAIKEEIDEYIISDWRSNAHTADEYFDFWMKSQQMRLKQIDEVESLTQILENWPEYRQNKDYIEMDFKAKFPDATIFSEVYNANFKKLEKMLISKISSASTGFKYMQQYTYCTPETKNLLILYLLHQLFPPQHKCIVDEMGIKRRTRSSIQDSQNAVFFLRGSQALLENAIKNQITAGTPPMVLIVGELTGDIDQIYVYFEGVQFPMDNVVQAVQLVCELFFLFNLDYPEDAILYYQFLQTYFLNIDSDCKNSRIYTTINEINAC